MFLNDVIDPVIDAFTAVDAFTCTPPDGSITVDAMNQDTPQDYVFDLYDEDPATGTPIANIPAGTNPVTFGNLAAGDYWITATHDTRDGNPETCVTATPLQITLLDISTPPDVVITYRPNTRCDANTPNGELHAQVSDPGGMEPAGGYTYLWSETSGPLHATAVGQGTADLTMIPEGNYDLTVTNNDTGCETIIDTYVLTQRHHSHLRYQ